MKKMMISAVALGVAFLAWHSLGLLAVLFFVWLVAMTTPNTAKTLSVEQRVTAAEGRLTVVENGVLPLVPGGAITFSGVGGPYTLHTGALSAFTDGTQTAFLAGLSGGPQLVLGTNSSGSPDGNSGTAWGTGERNYINGLWAAVAGINNYLNGHGFT